MAEVALQGACDQGLVARSTFNVFVFGSFTFRLLFLLVAVELVLSFPTFASG